MSPLVRMNGISKRFGRVTVLSEVDFEIWPGEVHALVGENGAGKSTLIKILGGVHTDHSGRIEVGGRVVRLRSPLHAGEEGIAIIHQELALAPNMSVADNLFLGRWPARAGLVRGRVQRAAARQLLRQFGIEVDVHQPLGELPIATQQLVEIAKALGREARVIVMDEPTSALNAPEVEKLFGLIADLKGRGCGIVYITHKMEEIRRIADRVTVLRDGRRVGSARAGEISDAEIIRLMVGRELEEQFVRAVRGAGRGAGAAGSRAAAAEAAERLRVERFNVALGGRRLVDSVSLRVRAGEILGLAGLQGSGNSMLLLGLFGALGRAANGRMWLDGRPVAFRSPRQALEAGVALVTNDRKATGLVLPLSVVANATLADLPRLAWAGWRRPWRERAAAGALARALQLRAASLDMPVAELSGGNQQKVVLAKCLQRQPRVLLLDEPTRGVDVGAKREVYGLMEEWTARGIAIVLITSELPELLALSDRVLVMHRGRVVCELGRAQASAEAVMTAAMGEDRAAAAPAGEARQS